MERRRNLLKLLGKIAPVDNATRAKVESADGRLLEVWFDRAIDAKALAEVFAD